MTKTNVDFRVKIAATDRGPRGTGRTLNNDELPRCAVILCLHVEASIMLRTFVIAALVAGILAKDTYVVVAPSKMRPGMDLSVSVNILHATADVSVTASVVRTSNNSEIVSATKTFREGHPGAIDLQIPDHLTGSGYELQVSGSGGLTFANKTTLAFSAKSKSIFVQTDKAMYKPGQTVNFRVFAAYPDLTLYTGPIDIEIFDPNTNKIKQWLAESATDGVITKELELSTLPVMGDGNQGHSRLLLYLCSSTAVLCILVLPKFEVSVELPSYVLTTAESIPVSVTAKYTYGQPVAGPVVVEAKLTNAYYQRYGALFSRQSSWTVKERPRSSSHAEIRRLSNNAVYAGAINFTANVTETLTGITLSGSSEVTAYTQPYKLEFLSSNPKTFKPALEYTAYVTKIPSRTASRSVTRRQDGHPENHGDGPGGAEDRHPTPTTTPRPPTLTWAPKPSQSPTTVSSPSPVRARQRHQPQHPRQCHAEYGGVSVYSNVERSYSPSNNYIQLFLRTTTRLQAGGQVDFEVRSTEPINDMVYQILSRGSIVSTGKVSAGGVTSFLFSTPVTSAMAPNARIVLYYVSVSVDRVEAQPAENVQVKVTATPRSTAYLLAVDQSVLLLKSGNDITQEQVIGELKTYDTIETASSPYIDVLPFGAIARRKRMIWFPFPRYYGGSDANQIFKLKSTSGFTSEQLRLLCSQNVAHKDGCRRCFDILLEEKADVAFRESARVDEVQPLPDNSLQEGGLQEVERVRSVFPETWMWTSKTVRCLPILPTTS
ncbi:hypothetical protein C0Q70_06252 [Pomacea canaliculata]|uniref:Alpha-2-macroglobulin bait region domain-containing protein n=1 Tax=Pomacea canaliculata TaxID=400727 RepID=A0A2T7PNH0_POMCA|nr:hypothetical protein C0Q70_06252 [Pomacea canaliculata]